MERAAHTHWSGNVNIDEIFATGCTENCQMTTFSATSDENSIKMTIFPLQCKVYRALIAVSELTCEPAVVTVQLYIARVTAPGVFGVLLLRLDLTASSLPSLLSPLSRFLREIPRPNKNKGWYRQHVLLSGRYYQVVVTVQLYTVRVTASDISGMLLLWLCLDFSASSLKCKCRHFVDIFIIGCTENCQKWQRPVQPMMKISLKWHFRFSVSALCAVTN